MKAVGGIRALFANSHQWKVDHLYCENLRSTGFRHSFPASAAHPDYGGARGGGHILLMTAKNMIYRFTPEGNSLINVQFLTSNGQAPSPGPPQTAFGQVLIDELGVEGCGYGVVYATGLDVTITKRSLIDTGTRRAGLGPSDPGFYDDYVQHAKLTVTAERFNPEYRSFTGPNGAISIMPDADNLKIGTNVYPDDSGLTVDPLVIPTNIIVTATLATQDRTVVLGTNGAAIGRRYAIDFVSPPSTGNFKLKIRNGQPGGTNLATMAARTWARFIYTGDAWNLEDSGSMVSSSTP